MKIQWYGHSCFIIETDNGTRLLTDPYGESVGYPRHELDVDAATISHGHHDHNDDTMLMGTPTVLRGAGTWEIGGVKITGIASWHDENQGALRGENTIFLFEADGLCLAHLGDLGVVPETEMIAKIGKVDILLAPVGGTYTIGPKEACEIANLTRANVLIPMHYQTSAVTLSKPLYSVEQLISTAKDCSIHRLNQSSCVITPASLGEDRLLVLDYVR